MFAGTRALAEKVVEELRARSETLSVAESCTGGMTGAAVTDIAGSSDVFLGGVIAYANGVKTGLLGVPRETLDVRGAVSAEVVSQMADGAARATGADYALAVSGVAGPGGGTADKPVGLVWIGLHTPQGTLTFEHRFDGDREAVRSQAVAAALQHLLEVLGQSD